MEVRISGISDLASARAANGLGPDYMGLLLATHGTGGISPIQVPDLVQWLPQARLVGQAHHLDADKALRLAELLQLGFAEVLPAAAQVFSPKLWVWCAQRPLWNNRANWVAASPDAHMAPLCTHAWVSLGPQWMGKLDVWREAGISRVDFPVQAYATPDGPDWTSLERMVMEAREG
ncbi:MAG: hypothetical protein HYZ16_00195 [Bacteroidetes bacterium]|nr:hypothetical protein [Bacteroidota bacterium]